jgi:predicted TIM-barrel fold metal-dependent hydrolase
MNFIDAHVHVWTDDLARYPIGDSYKVEQMKPPTFLPAEILSHAQPSGVNRVVLIQMSFYEFDNSYMLDVIADAPDTFRGVAIVDWHGPHPADAMRELKQRGVRGFRIHPGGIGLLHPPPRPPKEWLAPPGFAEMFQCAAEERMAICPLMNPDGIPALDRMCERFPDTPVAIDHLSRIGEDGTIREEDIDALCGLARRPEIKVKVSAFYALGEKRPPHNDLTELIRRVYDAFGPARLMWASDCPYQVQDETYEDGIDPVRDRLDFLSGDDKDWILRRTAEEMFFA